MESGADQLTVSVPVVPTVATTAVGRVGGRAATIAADGADDGELPTAEVARAVKVYEVPFVSPLMVQPVAGRIAVQRFPPGVDVTV